MTCEQVAIRPHCYDDRVIPGVAAIENEAAGEKGHVNETPPSSSKDGCGEAFVCIECDPCEEAPVKIGRDPGNPTEAEREDHCTTHMPYRSWCPICVKAKGKEEPHRSQAKKEKSIKPTVSFDYKSFGQEEDIDDKATAIVGKDDKSKIVFAHICLQKGSSDKWVVKKILDDLDRLGYTDMILKSDGEPAILQLLEELKGQRSHPTLLQHPPAYDPQANGAAENAVQAFMGHLRALKIGLEARLQGKIESDWAIMEWLVELSCEILNRCSVGLDGRTPYYRIYGKNSSKAVLEVGEQIMAKPLRGKKTNKKLSLKERWVFGTWVGIDLKTNGHLVILHGGGAAIKVRTVLRRPKADRWDLKVVSEIKATPRCPYSCK